MELPGDNRYISRVPRFPSKCHDISSTLLPPKSRQMSQILSRHLCRAGHGGQRAELRGGGEGWASGCGGANLRPPMASACGHRLQRIEGREQKDNALSAHTLISIQRPSAWWTEPYPQSMALSSRLLWRRTARAPRRTHRCAGSHGSSLDARAGHPRLLPTRDAPGYWKWLGCRRRGGGWQNGLQAVQMLHCCRGTRLH